MGNKQKQLNDYNGVQCLGSIESFGRLCDRARMYALDYLLSTSSYEKAEYLVTMYDIYKPEFTPIEQIFCIVYYQYVNELLNWQSDLPDIDSCPVRILFFEELEAQKEIFYKDRLYKCDFVIEFSRKNATNGKYFFPELKDLKYVIELDGHDYHSNKEQMAKDYERENDLKEIGYSVIRFTGSQVYNEPYSCVDKAISIILSDIKRKIAEV